MCVGHAILVRWTSAARRISGPVMQVSRRLVIFPQNYSDGLLGTEVDHCHEAWKPQVRVWGSVTLQRLPDNESFRRLFEVGG